DVGIVPAFQRRAARERAVELRGARARPEGQDAPVGSGDGEDGGAVDGDLTSGNVLALAPTEVEAAGTEVDELVPGGIQHRACQRRRRRRDRVRAVRRTEGTAIRIDRAGPEAVGAAELVAGEAVLVEPGAATAGRPLLERHAQLAERQRGR